MACFAAISAVTAGLTLVSAEAITVATDAPFPDYTYVDDQGTITGFERDVMDEVCDRASFRCAWVDTTFDRLIPGVIAGDYDIAIGGIAVTEDRRRIVDFTTAYHSTDDTEWFIGLPGTPPPAASLTAVQAGTVHETLLRGKGYRYISFSSETDVLDALKSGQADLAFGPYEARADLAGFLSDGGFDYLYQDEIPDDGVAMVVCKGNEGLLTSLNAALAAMRADGTLDGLETRWFN